MQTEGAAVKRGASAGRGGGADVHMDGAPLPLVEAGHAEGAAGGVADQDGEPDVERVEGGGLLDGEADAERDDHLGDDGDVERAAGVAGPLEAARVGEGDGDEEAGEGEDAQELRADLDHGGLVHPEDAQELAGDEEEDRKSVV